MVANDSLTLPAAGLLNFLLVGSAVHLADRPNLVFTLRLIDREVVACEKPCALNLTQAFQVDLWNVRRFGQVLLTECHGYPQDRAGPSGPSTSISSAMTCMEPSSTSVRMIGAKAGLVGLSTTSVCRHESLPSARFLL